MQVVFDSSTYGSNNLTIVFGGFDGIETRVFPVDIRSIKILSDESISTFDEQKLKYKI